MTRTTTTRRRFLAQSAGAAVGLLGAPGILSARSPNEKLNIAGIGAGRQAFNDLRGAQAGVENIVALADVDWKRGARGFEAWPQRRGTRTSGGCSTSRARTSTRWSSGLPTAIAGKYSEWLLLGAAAVHYDGKLLWDPARGEFTNNPNANKGVKPTFRKGWEISL